MKFKNRLLVGILAFIMMMGGSIGVDANGNGNRNVTSFFSILDLYSTLKKQGDSLKPSNPIFQLIVKRDIVQIRRVLHEWYRRNLCDYYAMYGIRLEQLSQFYVIPPFRMSHIEGFGDVRYALQSMILDYQLHKKLEFVTNQCDAFGNNILHLAAIERNWYVFNGIKNCMPKDLYGSEPGDVYFYMLSAPNKQGYTPLHILVGKVVENYDGRFSEKHKKTAESAIRLIRYILPDICRLRFSGFPHEWVVNKKDGEGRTALDMAKNLYFVFSATANSKEIAGYYQRIVNILECVPEIINIIREYEILPVSSRTIPTGEIVKLKSYFSRLENEDIVGINTHDGGPNLKEWALNCGNLDLADYIRAKFGDIVATRA